MQSDSTVRSQPDGDQRAGVAAQDALEPVAQRGAGRDRREDSAQGVVAFVVEPRVTSGRGRSVWADQAKSIITYAKCKGARVRTASSGAQSGTAGLVFAARTG